jgi:hypothetical protein
MFSVTTCPITSAVAKMPSTLFRLGRLVGKWFGRVGPSSVTLSTEKVIRRQSKDMEHWSKFSPDHFQAVQVLCACQVGHLFLTILEKLLSGGLHTQKSSLMLSMAAWLSPILQIQHVHPKYSSVIWKVSLMPLGVQ